MIHFSNIFDGEKFNEKETTKNEEKRKCDKEVLKLHISGVVDNQ